MEVREFAGIRPNTNTTIFGVRGCGKTTLVKDLLRSHPEMPVHTLVNPISDSYYDVVASHVYNEYSPECIEQLTHVFPTPVFCVIDDALITCAESDVSLEADEPYIAPIHARLHQFMRNSRHYKVSTIITQQYVNLPEYSINIDYIFIGKLPTIRDKCKAFERCAGMFPTFEAFLDVYNSIVSTPYTFMVIDNTSQSNKIEDQVFYYKANVS